MTSTESHRHAHGDDPMHNPDVAHEGSDIDVGTVLKAAAGLVVVVVICAMVIRVLFGVLERQAAAGDPRPSAVARPAGQLPPEPRLVINERAGLAKFRAEEAKVLDGYGWVNQGGGVAHIPVAEARKLLVQRGLAARTTPAGPQEGTHAPAMGEASGGRTIQMKPAAGEPTPGGAK